MAEIKPESVHPAWQLLFQGAWPMSAVFLGSHRRLAGANQDGTILIWDLPEKPVAGKIKDDQGKEIDGIEAPGPVRKLEGHSNAVTRMLASADGKTLVSASLDRTVRIWDLTAAAAGKGEIVLDQRRRENESRRVEKEKRDTLLNAPGVPVETQPALATLPHRDWINALGQSADGKRFISGDDSGLAIVWDLTERKEINRWQCEGIAWIVAAALSPDGETALVSQYRNHGGEYNNYPAGLRLYNVADGSVKLDILKTLYPKEKNPKYQYQYEYHQFVAAGLIAAAFSPDGKTLALGQGGESGEGKLHFLEVETGKVIRTVPGHQNGVTDLAYSRDGTCLFSSGRDTLIRVTKVEDGKEIAKIGKSRGGQFSDWTSSLTLSPDEHWLATSDISGLIQVWELGEPIDVSRMTAMTPS